MNTHSQGAPRGLTPPPRFVKLSTEHKPAHNYVDRRGRQFGRLTVLALAGHAFDLAWKKRKPVYLCKCQCGNLCYTLSGDLTTKRSVSCGCYKSEATSIFNTLTKTRSLRCTKNSVWQSYKTGARNRGIEWSLSLDEFFDLTQRSCWYCGTAPKQKRKARGGRLSDFVYNGVDRFDNTKGYVKDNCIPCCGKCNKMKSDTPYVEWILRLKQIILLHDTRQKSGKL